jgi:ABC-type antimicrobial peptide transport system permease subunit
MALGADASRVVGMVMRRGAVLVTLGVAAGAGGAFILTRFLSGVLYGVTATDGRTFGAMTVLLFAVALAACAIPARRAARVNPAAALRSE